MDKFKLPPDPWLANMAKKEAGGSVQAHPGPRKSEAAPGEARTHGLQIMRLTRCLLRYGGLLWLPGASHLAQTYFLSPLLLGGQNKNAFWQRWDSNPRLRGDWCLKPAP